MATRADYRTALQNKLLGLEDGGYGDFEYTDSELNMFLEFAVARLYPAIYKKLSEVNQSLTPYGTAHMGYLEPAHPERVFLIESADELEVVTGWRVQGTRIVGISTLDYAGSFNVYYHDAFTMPDDDVTDLGLSAVYTPLVVLGALIEALEARHDTGVRGDPPPSGQYTQTQLLDRLTPRYEALKAELAMSMPAVSLL